MEEDNLVEELLGEEQAPEETKKYTSIAEFINQSFAIPMFFFTVETAGPTKATRGEVAKYWSIDEIMNDENFASFITTDTRNKYQNIIANPVADIQGDLADIVVDIYDDISSVKKQQRIEQESTATRPVSDIIITFDKKKTDAGPGEIDYKSQSDAIKEQDLSEIILGEEVTEAAETAQDVQQAQGAIRTSHPTWGYKTTKNGTIINSAGEEVPAPFWKGNEYSMFTDMDPSEIFTLQQKMVRAGMDAPTVNEYGQWTDREANFMSAVFIKAADDPNFSWEKDIAAGLPAYTTALDNLMTEVGETEDFIKLLNEANYLQSKANVSPSQIQQLIDQAAAELDIVLTPQDYVDYGTLAVQAYGDAAALQRDYESSLITDRDVILGSTYKDVRATQPGEFPRYLKGSTLPLVLPSYEYLMGQKGEAPVVKSALEIITEELAKRPEIQQQQAAAEDLNNIKYATNLFEASMGAIGLGENI